MMDYIRLLYTCGAYNRQAQQAVPGHDYCQYCPVPCYAGELPADRTVHRCPDLKDNKILFKIEDLDESCQGEYLFDIVIDVPQCQCAAVSLGTLQNTEQDT